MFADCVVCDLQHRLYQGVLYFQNAWFYGTHEPIKKVWSSHYYSQHS